MNERFEQIDASSSFEEMEAQDRRRVVLEHALPSLMTFLPVCAGVGITEWMTRPTHRTALVIVGSLYVLICAVFFTLLRRRPQWAVPIAVGGVSAICAAMLSYSPMVRGSGELCVLSVTVLLGGFAVAFPLGLRNQLLASIVPVVGYIAVLQLGTTTAYPVWYSASALTAFLFVLAIGARAADLHRSRILLDAYRQTVLATENARLRDEARAADSAKTDLLSILSHELRTPIGNMRMLSELLVGGRFTEKDEWIGLAKRMAAQSKEASDLVQTMLEFGSMETGVLRISIEPTDVAELLHGIRVDIPAPWYAPNVEIIWQIPAPGLLMRTDRGKLVAIVRNLLHNALRHTQNGSVTVTARAGDIRDVVVFAIADTGEGIADEALPQIFDRFSRATSMSGGFGLGLYIVKRFAEALGGDVLVDSKRGVGTRFEVVVPRESTTQPQAASRAA